MKSHAVSEVQKLSLVASEPMVRCDVEASRGQLTFSIEGELSDEGSIQWMQNGTPIRGQRSPVLHLAGLSPDDTDVYFAKITSPSGETRSQSAMVVVWPGAPLVNFSTRGWVTPAKPLIAGFVIGRAPGPGQPKTYLIRAIGSSLRKFGVTETLSQPLVSLLRRDQSCQELLKPDDARISELQRKSGAFALEPGSTDFVAIAELTPGPYTITVTSQDGGSGEILIEIYETAS